LNKTVSKTKIKKQNSANVKYLNKRIERWKPGKLQLIPALVGREVSDAERQILALPLRHCGLGLTNHKETAKT